MARGRNLVLAQVMLAACAILAVSPHGASASEPLPEGEILLGPIRAHLFYKGSGRLSEDLFTREPSFIAWNTVIGAGDAEEAADDILFVVPVRANEEQFTDDPLTIRVTDSNGKVLTERVHGSILTSDEGYAYLPLWADDLTCGGELAIKVKFRNQQRSKTLAMHCGE